MKIMKNENEKKWKMQWKILKLWKKWKWKLLKLWKMKLWTMKNEMKNYEKWKMKNENENY